MADKGFKLWESDYEVLQEMTDSEKAEYITIMCEFYFDGVEVEPKEIESKTVRLAWKARRPVLDKSRRNAKDYSNRVDIQNKAQEEPFKEEGDKDIIKDDKVSKIAQNEVVQPDLSNEANDILDLYENELYGAYKYARNHPDEKNDCQRKWLEILTPFGCEDSNNPIRRELAGFCCRKFKDQQIMRNNELEEIYA